METRILQIECCDNCFYSRVTYEKGFDHFCTLKDKNVKEDIDFPTWCPLPKTSELTT